MITTVGSQAQDAQSAASDAQASQTQLVSQQQSVSGVSTDQEMTEMLQFQNAYQASARFISTSAAMLNTLVTGMFASG
jgi:flagellar hook-associated protein 1 FlgK